MSTEKRVYVVTGSSRGLGLALVRQLAAGKNNLVFATARDPESAAELKKLASEHSGSVELVKLDTASETSIAEGAKAIAAKTKKVHVLINNAAINEANPSLKTSKSELLNSFSVNAVGPLLLIQALWPLIEAAQKDSKTVDAKSVDVPKVINISSTVGSNGVLLAEKKMGKPYSLSSEQNSIKLIDSESCY